MRFIKNQSKRDCCIVSILNACKYFGQSVSYKDYQKQLKTYLHYKPNKGCPTKIFLYYMKRIRNSKLFNIKTIAVTNRGNHKHINKLINKNLIAMIILNGHIFLLTEVRKKSYKVINYSSTSKVVSYIPKKKFTKLMKNDNITLWIQQNKR